MYAVFSEIVHFYRLRHYAELQTVPSEDANFSKMNLFALSTRHSLLCLLLRDCTKEENIKTTFIEITLHNRSI